MTIPKNLDNSGTAILYIVGPGFRRFRFVPVFVGPTFALTCERRLILPRGARQVQRLFGGTHERQGHRLVRLDQAPRRVKPHNDRETEFKQCTHE